MRISDRILLSCRRLDKEQYEAIVTNFKKGISLYNQEDVGNFVLYLGAQAALARIREKDEHLGEFLRHLDTKINRLLAIVSKEPSPLDKLQPQEVDISGTGMAFLSTEKIKAGDALEIQMVLLPDHTHIYTVARAVSSEKPANLPTQYACRVACQFNLIMDEDREVIIQHVFKRQKLALRNKRQKRNS